MARTKTPPAHAGSQNPPAGTGIGVTRPADDFDESTPPPRTRPRGDPLPRFVRFPPGEDIPARFAEWDKAGRVPAGSVLVRFVGTGYVPGRSGLAAPDGDPITPAEAAKLRPVADVVVGGATWVVMTREG